MKLFWHGVGANLKTGYGVQTKLFTPAIKAAGHDISIASRVDQYQTGLDSNGIVNHSSGHGTICNYGNDTIRAHVWKHKPDAVLSMCDPFTCEPTVFDDFPWYPWVFTDCEPPLFENMEVLKACRRPIAPTRHCWHQLIEAGFDPFYCPLAIDTSIYHPKERTSSRAYLAEAIGHEIGGRFLAVMNSANHSSPSRKNFAAAFKAWAMFEKKYPDSLLYVHADKYGKMQQGEDLSRVEKLYGVKNIVYAPQYEYNCGLIGEEFLATAYSAADVFLHTATGEGFGLPIVEARSCGCPVIVPRFGAMDELCGTGLQCDGRLFMRFAGSEQFLVDERAVGQALEMAWRRHDPLSDRVPDIGVEAYDIKAVMENHCLPMLKEIEQETNEKKGQTK